MKLLAAMIGVPTGITLGILGYTWLSLSVLGVAMLINFFRGLLSAPDDYNDYY